MEPPLPHDLCDPPDDTLLQPKVPNLMSFVLNGQRIIPRLHPSASYRDQTLHPQIPQAPKNFGRHSRSTVAARCKSSKKRKKYRARHMSLGQEQMGQEEENPMHGPHSFPKSVAHAPVPRPSGIHVELPLPPGMNSDWRIQYSEDTQIRTGFWNVNGSPHTDHHVAETLAETMKLLGLSVLCLSDVRLTNAAGKWFSYRFKKYMPGAAVCIFPTTRESDKGARGSYACMGGSIVLVDPSLAPFLTNTRADPTGTSLVVALEFKRGGQPFAILSVYLPPYAPLNKPESAALHSRIQRYLRSKGINGTSHRVYLQDLISKWVTSWEARHVTVIMGGDLNGITENTRGRQTLLPWISGLRMTIPLTSLLLPRFPGYYTRISGDSATRIDHIGLSRLPPSWSISEIAVDNDSPMSGMSDHRPIYIGLRIEGFSSKVPTVVTVSRPPRMDINLKDKPKRAQYAASVQNWTKDNEVAPDLSPEESAKRIASIMRTSLDAVKDTLSLKRATLHAACRRLRSNIKDGYSHEFMALKDTFIALGKLLDLAYDGHKKITRTYWTRETYMSTLIQWSQRLERRLKDIRGRAEANGETFELPMVLFVYSIQVISTMEYAAITRSFLIGAVNRVRNAMHGRQRVEMRIRMSEGKADLEDKRIAGKIGKVIRALSDKPTKYLDLSYMSDPVKGYDIAPLSIHSRIKQFFRDDWYANPSGLDPLAESIANDPSKWQDILHAPEDDVPLMRESNIPLELQGSLKKACRMKASPHIRDMMTEALAEPISLHEFKAAVKHLPPDKAPGPSMVTPNMIKAGRMT